MALIRCPECDHEVSSIASSCPYCGYPINSNPNGDNRVSSSKKVNSKRKKSIIVCVIIASCLLIWASVFHLFGKDAIAYELIVSYVSDFKSPKSVRVISGTAGEIDDNDGFDGAEGKYAFLTISATNSYGAQMTDYYHVHEMYGFHKTDEDYSRKLCKENDLHAWKINLRLQLHWLFA